MTRHLFLGAQFELSVHEVDGDGGRVALFKVLPVGEAVLVRLGGRGLCQGHEVGRDLGGGVAQLKELCQESFY